jgi:tetratricopeptide (TPR) repeat protein
VPLPLRKAARNEIVRNETVGALIRYSLVERDQAGISLHRLVQAVIRHTLKLHERRRWARLAVRLVAAGFPDRSDDLFAWRRCQLLLPHALAAARWSKELGIENETAAALLDRIALYLWARADLEQARELLESTHAMIEARLGPRHIEAATNRSTLGKVLREFGDLAGAKDAHMRALAIRRCQPKRDPESIAWSLGNLGKVLRGLRDLTRARRFHQRALAILEAARGPKDPDVAWCLGNLGRALLDLGDLAEARSAHERALAIRESVLPPNHPDVAWSLRNLGATLQALGQPHEARERYRQALDIFQARFGPDHPEAVTTRRSLHTMSNELGELQDQSHAGFETLFDDLGLWKMAGPGRFKPLGDGVMETEGGMGLWWYTKRMFRDLVLQVDWMATSEDDNSGVFLRFPDPDDDPWIAVRNGYEVQIDDRPGSDWKTGAIYGFQEPSRPMSKPVGEWNSYEIQVVDQRYTVMLNGVKVNDFEGDRRTEGYVGLQNHGPKKVGEEDYSRVRFRNLRVKALSPADP